MQYIRSRISGLMSKNKKQKILFLFQGLTHYYNRVLSKLNDCDDLEVIVVVPRISTRHGAGVYETETGADFRFIKLDEVPGRNVCEARFMGLWKVILAEKPSVLVVSEPHLASLYTNPFLLLLIKCLDVKVLLKSIPFMVPLCQKLKDDSEKELSEGLIKASPRFAATRKRLMNSRFPILQKVGGALTLMINICRELSGKYRIARRLAGKRYFYRFPDGHVNYIEDAYKVFGSYGVGRERVFITGNSPDTDLLLNVRNELLNSSPAVEKHPHRIIHVGRLVEWKRVDLLIRAFVRIKTKYPDAELLVVGAGPEKEQLEKLAVDCGVKDATDFYGGIYDPHELGRLFMSSTVYVLAGMGGLSINEAMCFELPVVCSVCDGTEKRLVRDGHNGFSFKDGCEDDLVARIDTLYSRPILCKEMGRNSLSIIRNEINIHTVIDGYKKAFDCILGRVSVGA